MSISGEPGVGAITTLRVIAWLSLAGGIILALLFWSQASQPEVIEDPILGMSIEDRTDPVMIALGIAAALQAAIVWAVLVVLSYMAENLILIRRGTYQATSAETGFASRPSEDVPLEQESSGPAPGEVVTTNRLIHVDPDTKIQPGEEVKVKSVTAHTALLEKDGKQVVVHLRDIRRMP